MKVNVVVVAVGLEVIGSAVGLLGKTVGSTDGKDVGAGITP